MADKKQRPLKAPSTLKIETPSFMVSKISISPKRKFGLPNYSNVELSAGLEIVFAQPLPIDSPLITEAYEKGTTKLQEEFKRQLYAFGIKKKEPKPAGASGGDGTKVDEVRKEK